MERRPFVAYSIAIAIAAFAAPSKALKGLAPAGRSNDAPIPEIAVATPEDLGNAKIEKTQGNWHWYGQRGNPRFSRRRHGWRRYKWQG